MMTADILPLFAGDMLDAAVRVFDPARHWLDREMREGAAVFGRLRSVLADELEAASRELRDGTEAKSFVARHKPAADALARFFAVAWEMRAAIEKIEEHPGAGELIAAVAAAEAEATALRKVLDDAFQKATAPYPKLDAKKIREVSQAAREAGRLVRYATKEDIARDLCPSDQGGAADALPD